MRWGLTLILHHYLSFGMDFFEQRDIFSSFLFLGKKQKLLLIYRQVICMCFQVYGLSNIDLLRCVCMFVVPRSLPHSIFVYIARVLFVQLPLFESQTDSVLSTIFCLSVFLSECVCLCFLLLHESKRREGGKDDEGRRNEQPGKYKQTQQQLHIRLYTSRPDIITK